MHKMSDIEDTPPCRGTIYCIQHRQTKHVYIGSTRCYDLMTRISRHLDAVINGSRCRLHSAIRLVGIKNFQEHFEWREPERQFFKDKNEMLLTEQKYIELFKANHPDHGYNINRAKLTREAKNLMMVKINNDKHKKDIANKRFFCAVCNLACQSNNHLQRHCAGVKHKERAIHQIFENETRHGQLVQAQ